MLFSVSILSFYGLLVQRENSTATNHVWREVNTGTGVLLPEGEMLLPKLSWLPSCNQQVILFFMLNGYDLVVIEI